MCFWESDKDGCLLRIKLTPNASFCGFGELWTAADGLSYLKAYVTVVPEKGKANAELLKLLAKKLNISKSCLQIVSGETDHLKKIMLKTDLMANLQDKLKHLIKENR